VLKSAADARRRQLAAFPRKSWDIPEAPREKHGRKMIQWKRTVANPLKTLVTPTRIELVFSP
jgi:hypothetical protein